MISFAKHHDLNTMTENTLITNRLNNIYGMYKLFHRTG